jgi:PIN domain nuclease of toxin-antitoxin system
MRILLDTHTLIWAVDDVGKLSPAATAELTNASNVLLVSAATIWEIAIKLAVRKLSISLPFLNWINKALTDLPATLLAISQEHADRTISLPFHHRDPFDRMLVAQAIVENMPLISSDPTLDAYPIRRTW